MKKLLASLLKGSIVTIITTILDMAFDRHKISETTYNAIAEIAREQGYEVKLK